MILNKIVENQLKTLEVRKEQKPMDILCSEIPKESLKRSFTKGLVREGPLAIIAEIKKASPSKGIIKEDFDPLEIAREYELNQVEAISVLTETDYFLGNNRYLTNAKEVTTRPILRKDFIVDPYQIVEAKVIGADAILLIVAILSKKKLSSFIELSTELGLECLVEVHNMKELEIAIECEAKVIGINNRNLYTFEVDLHHTELLMDKMPKDKIVVSESGIDTAEDIKYLKDLGVHAALIGESLMRANSIKDKLLELRGF